MYPPNWYNETSTSGTNFTYNVSDNGDIENCSLIVDGEIYDTDYSVTKDTNQYFVTLLSNGIHNWSVLCFDDAGNYDYSSNRTIKVSIPPIAWQKRWYETSTDNYTSTAYINLDNSRDSTENNIDVSVGSKTLYTLVEAKSPFIGGNGAIIYAGTISFSAVVSASSPNKGYLTWKVYITNSSGDFLICKHGDDSTSGTRISSASGTWTGSCDISNNITLKSTDRIKLILNVWNNGNSQVTFTHYWDCLLYTSPSPRDLSTYRMPSSA